MRVIDENLDAPRTLLLKYAVICLPIALFIRLLIRSDGFLECLVLLATVPIATLFIYYHVSSFQRRLRAGFRFRLTILVGMVCAVLQSHVGMANAVFYGVVGGLVGHVLGMLAAATADLVFAQIRQFARAGHCRKCDYDLTGNESGQCPECGWPAPRPNPWLR
jgi:hypothetical protein